jgi:hypothetical protein
MQILHSYGCTSDTLITALEQADHDSHTTAATRARWLLPLLQVCTGAAVTIGRQIERVNR